MAIKLNTVWNSLQASDDLYWWTEDELLALNYLNANNIITLDVVENDSGGTAKSLYSIDDGGGNFLQDMLDNNISTGWEYTASGNRIRIVDGKIEFDISHDLNLIGGTINGLSAGESLYDTFTYSIQLGNGTLSWATVTIRIDGVNDAPVAVADTSAGDEDTIITGSVATNDSDPDHNAVLSYSLDAAVAGLTLNADGSYSLDASDAAYQYLAAGEQLDVVAYYTVTDEWGASSSSTLTINITGTNDAAVLSADVVNLTETNSAADISASGTLTISDIDSPETFIAQAGTVGLYGTFAIDSAGAWTYTASSAHDEFVAGTIYTDSFQVFSADGTETSVTINITGSSDGLLPSGSVVTLRFNPQVGTLPDPPSCVASSINNNGEVVGWSGAPWDDFYDVGIVSFIYQDGAFTRLENPAAGITGATFAEDINDTGTVVGHYRVGHQRTETHGFVYNSGTYTTFDAPFGVTYGLTINNNEVIAGSYSVGNSTPQNSHGFIYSNGQFTTLDHPLANSEGGTVINDINDLGEIVGAYYTGSGGSTAIHGFLYNGSDFTNLDFIPTAINNYGEISGGGFVPVFGAGSFLYKDGDYIPLEPIIYPNPTLPPNQTLGTAAIGINDKGQIVGSLPGGFESRGGARVDGYIYTPLIPVPNGDLVLTGTSYPEVFDFSSVQFGYNTINGFDLTRDTIRFSQTQATDFIALQTNISSFAGGTLISLDALTSITLTGVAPAGLGDTNFQFV